jgi:hypothetical protein
MGMNPRLLRPIASGIDPVAGAWRSAVLAAGSSVNGQVVRAVDQFVRGCRSDGIWDAIEACCILCGPDSLPGALVPLVGTAPTNFNNNFVTGDYNRTTGLKGDGSTTYLNLNRSPNTGLQNDNHYAAYATAVDTRTDGTFRCYIGAGTLATGRSNFFRQENNSRGDWRNNAATVFTQSSQTFSPGFFGASRANSTGFTVRYSGGNHSATVTSESPTTENFFLFAANQSGTAVSYVDARMAFYSIGKSINLQLLDSRVSALVTAIGAS